MGFDKLFLENWEIPNPDKLDCHLLTKRGEDQVYSNKIEKKIYVSVLQHLYVKLFWAMHVKVFKKLLVLPVMCIAQLQMLNLFKQSFC